MKFIFRFFFLLSFLVFSISFLEEENQPVGFYCFEEIPTEVDVDYEDYVDQEFYNSTRRVQQSKDLSLHSYFEIDTKSTYFITQSVLKKNSFYIYLVEPILTAHRLNLYLFQLF